MSATQPLPLPRVHPASPAPFPAAGHTYARTHPKTQTPTAAAGSPGASRGWPWVPPGAPVLPPEVTGGVCPGAFGTLILRLGSTTTTDPLPSCFNNASPQPHRLSRSPRPGQPPRLQHAIRGAYASGNCMSYAYYSMSTAGRNTRHRPERAFSRRVPLRPDGSLWMSPFRRSSWPSSESARNRKRSADVALESAATALRFHAASFPSFSASLKTTPAVSVS